jgi:uncharacterized hydrophobic protein (TIGR00271 family)
MRPARLDSVIHGDLMSSLSAMPRSEVKRIEEALFFEPPHMRARLIRFTMLIIFASVIASGGLLSDSVASIIGAMIVAPLMTPIMGMVVALVLGSKGRFVRSFILVLAGITLSIGVGWIMAEAMPFGWNPLMSDQVLARTSPRLLDLVIALASGGAGAYALSRSDVADALPGVAIAISLVPPLNTVGILLAGNEGELAWGAALLFITNFTAILLAGTITFILTGLATTALRQKGEIRNSIAAIIVVVVLVAIPLLANSRELWTDTNRADKARAVVEAWLAPTTFEIYRIDVDESDVSVVLAGEGDLPPAGEAIEEIRRIMGGEMNLTARILVVQTVVIADDEERP